MPLATKLIASTPIKVQIRMDYPRNDIVLGNFARTSQKVTYPDTTPSRAHLTTYFLRRQLDKDFQKGPPSFYYSCPNTFNYCSSCYGIYNAYGPRIHCVWLGRCGFA